MIRDFHEVKGSGSTYGDLRARPAKTRAESEGRPEQAIVDEIASRIPLGEIVPDEDVAEAALFLASDRARFITGQTLMVNGGELMR